MQWPKTNREWERFSAFLAALLEEPRYGNTAFDLKKIASEAGCFDLSNFKTFESQLGTVLCVEPVETALQLHGPTDHSLKTQIQSQIFEYEL